MCTLVANKKNDTPDISYVIVFCTVKFNITHLFIEFVNLVRTDVFFMFIESML